jgi:hypothetical protein
VPQCLVEHILFAGEVAVHGGAARAARLGDVGDAHGVVAALGDEPPCGRQDLPAALVPDRPSSDLAGAGGLLTEVVPAGQALDRNVYLRSHCRLLRDLDEQLA